VQIAHAELDSAQSGDFGLAHDLNL